MGGDIMETMTAAGEDLLEVKVGGKVVRVVSRPADDDRQSRLFELDLSPAEVSGRPLSDEDVASVVRGLIDGATLHGQKSEVVGVSPGAARAFPDDPRISICPVPPVSFSLPSSATQARMEIQGSGELRLVWRRLDGGVVGDVVALHELPRESAAGWLSILVPVLDQLERQRVHRQRLSAAKTAEKWARDLERRSN
jgi:hypothetical protein